MLDLKYFGTEKKVCICIGFVFGFFFLTLTSKCIYRLSIKLSVWQVKLYFKLLAVHCKY